MENKLKALFDFQKFEGNDELSSVIEKTHGKFRGSGSSFAVLGDDDLGYVSAAGEQVSENKDDLNKK